MIASDSALLSAAYRRVFVAVLFLVCLFNFADRAAFAVLSQPIKTDLHLSDLQLGLLQGLSFALLYALLGLPIGRLAERANRIWIVSAATLIWSAATAACGFAQGFAQLMVARIGVGFGDAGFSAPTASLTSDHFPPLRRASVMALIMLGTPAGLLFGSVVAGFAAGQWGWRAAFWAVGLPGLAVAALVLVVLREPPRGLADGRSPRTAPPPLGAFLRAMVQRPALRSVVLGGAVAGFGMTAISQFLPMFLVRVHHIPIREAGPLYGLISSVSLTIGLLAGSFGTDWLAKRDRRWPALGAACGLCTAPLVYLLAFRATGRTDVVLLLTLAGSLLLLFYGPTIGMIQNLLEPGMRTTGAALFSTLYTLFGAGLGPVFVGFVSDRFAQAAFAPGEFSAQCAGIIASPSALARACAAASAAGIADALQISVCVFFAAAALYLLASRTLRAEFYAAQDATR